MARTLLSLFALLSLVVAGPAVQASETGLALSATDHHEIIENAAGQLETRYVDEEIGKRLARQLRQARSNWSGLSDPKAFAAAVTAWLRQASGDGHLGLSYSVQPIPETAGVEAFSAQEMLRWYGPQINHGVERIERLEDNIMLLDLRVFPPPAMAGDVFAAAMTVVAQGDALIIDLRRNGGGSETVGLITGYLLDPGRPLSGTYDRPTNTHTANTSPAWVPGRRFGSTKPLYILTSRRTFSAAEALAYDLQALKRATLVGEVTGGGAHPYEYRRVHRHFALDLPEGRSINPITGGNWQGKGVVPDVLVPADQALERAIELARARLSAEHRIQPASGAVR
jgi:Peptidase family S41